MEAGEDRICMLVLGLGFHIKFMFFVNLVCLASIYVKNVLALANFYLPFQSCVAHSRKREFLSFLVTVVDQQ